MLVQFSEAITRLFRTPMFFWYSCFLVLHAMWIWVCICTLLGHLSPRVGSSGHQWWNKAGAGISHLQQQEIPKDKRMSQARVQISEGCGNRGVGEGWKIASHSSFSPENAWSLGWNKSPRTSGPLRQVNSPLCPCSLCKYKLMELYVYQLH